MFAKLNYTHRPISLTSVSVLPSLSGSLCFPAPCVPENLNSFPSTLTCTSVITWILSSGWSISPGLAGSLVSNGLRRVPKADSCRPYELRPCSGALFPRDLAVLGNILGNHMAINGRRHGRHEQMMLMLVSTEDQVAAGGLS